jgi:hypothetical protein
MADFGFESTTDEVLAGHWAAWGAKRQKILDQYYKRTRPLSCLIVLRRKKPASK